MQTADQQDLELLRYPTGRFSRPARLSIEQRRKALESLERFPRELRASVNGWSDSDLDTPYREGGWTVRQVVHHVADSHLNAYARIRLALTEDWPTIMPYQEALWAELHDAQTMPVDVSLALLEALHARWVDLLRATPETDFQARGYHHPESGKQSLDQVLALYAWHGGHHLGHVAAARAHRKPHTT